MLRRPALALLLSLSASSALAEGAAPTCDTTVLLSPAQLGASERSAVTSGVFLIGTLPAPVSPAGSWILQVDTTEQGLSPTPLVAGTLEGTEDGRLGGAPRGEACTFSGMAAQGDLLYAACVAKDGRTALVRVDVRAKTVLAGAFDSCNFEPRSEPCRSMELYPNGMAVDEEGRVYFTDMNAHGLTGGGKNGHSIGQVVVDELPQDGGRLRFRHRAFLAKDVLRDGPAPNGVQIRGDALYYVGGANIHAVPILEDGRAGEPRVHYEGPVGSYIDDFALGADEIILARTNPVGVVRLAAAEGAPPAAVATCQLPADAVPSSISYLPKDAPGISTGTRGALLVTSYFQGGLYTVRFD